MKGVGGSACELIEIRNSGRTHRRAWKCHFVNNSKALEQTPVEVIEWGREIDVISMRYAVERGAGSKYLTMVAAERVG